MIDPKDPNFDHEAATLVPDGRSSPPAPKNTAVQTPPPDSSSPESSEAPTMLEGALPPLPPITRPNVAGGRVTPVTPIPPGSTFAGLMLPPGTVLGNRYEILQILGEGGMGAVYKARDIELDRVMALKVIRPELASNPEILQRFKQELILARQVTDRNVIRIFDLGEADGIKFITMEYVEGESLYQILKREGKVPVAEAVDIMKQMLGGLLAAHREGVIHRDLKPGNVMRDAQGRVVVMDFGLARSFAGDGMTRTGAMLGTMEYMSPEQAQAKELDARSDLFTVGLICYELLTGKMPYQADSVVASLIKRNSERAIPIVDQDPTIPIVLSNIVSKCLERDPNHRYQNATELLHDLEAWEGNRAGATLRFQPAVEPWGRTIHWPIVMGIVTVLILAIGGYVFRGTLFSSSSKKAVTGPAVSLAILPFRNASGDPSVDWLGPSLADMLSTDVGQSARLRTVSQDRLHQVLSDLRIAPNASIETTTLRRLAEFSNADTVVWGQYVRFGGQIRIDATLQDLKHDRTVPIKVEGIEEKDIPGAVDRLATSIRNNLDFSSDAIKELKASSFQPTSRSAPALRDYNQGVQLIRDGKNLDAVKALQSATKEDAEFALAYSRLAEADSALGYDGDAEQASRRAVELSQQSPPAEKYLIQATHARIIKDNKKAIEAYENLAKSMPDNSDVESALGGLYTDTGNYDMARAQLTKLLASDPKNIKGLWQMGVLEIVSGNAQAALEPLNKGLSLEVQVNAPELKGLMLQAMGIAYRMMNKPEDAVGKYQEAMAINQRFGLKRALASNLIEMAVVQNTQGKVDAALSDYNQALQLQREIGMKKEVGDTLIDMGVVYQSKGDYDKALQNFKESLQIQRDAGDENYQALCLSNIGGVYLEKGDSDNAFTYLQQALQLREKLKVDADIAETLSALGQVYISTGQYDQALTTSMRALDLWRKAGNAHGAADESHAIGLVFQYQGRFGAAVHAMEDAVKGYRAVGDRSADMIALLNDLADALAQAGRGSESDALLHEAQTLVGNLKNESLKSALLSTQGDVRRFSGDSRSAEGLYKQALQTALRGNDPDQILISKLHVAEMGLNRGNPNPAIREFGQLMQEADSHNRKLLSLESSLDRAEALMERNAYPEAQQELQGDLGKGEKLGSRYQNARIHYLLATALRLAGNKSDASGQYRLSLNLMDEMRKDPGAEKLLDRADLKLMYTEASRFAPDKN
jgi:eukaryotic-like serine/threonine-protein kinase